MPPPSRRKLTCEELSLRQNQDALLKEIIEKIGGANESWNFKRGEFRLINGVLYHIVLEREGKRRWLLAVPSSIKLDVVEACHDDPEGGHEGVTKTVNRIRARFW